MKIKEIVNIKNWLMIFLVLVLLSIPFTQIQAKTIGYIQGTVLDSISNSPLTGASIRLEGTSTGSIAGNSGSFFINASSGKYKMLISMVGYQTMQISVFIRDYDTTRIHALLQIQPLKTGEIVISANKRVQAVQEVPVSVSIIDFSDITDKNIIRIDEALRFVPGVNMNGDQVNIRGSSGITLGIGSRVAFLADGFPILAADGGDMKFDAIPALSLQRVEVVKGAGSALYGSSALGGVINLITKEPTEKTEFILRSSSGIFTKPKYSQWVYKDKVSTNSFTDFSFSKKWGFFGTLLSAGVARNESYRLFDDSFRWNVFGKFGFELSGLSKLSLTGSYSKDNKADFVYWNSIDSATIPPYDTIHSRTTSEKLTACLEFRQIFNYENFLIFRSGFYGTNFRNTIPETSLDYRASKAYSIFDELQMNSFIYSTTMLTYGLNFTFNNIESKIYGFRKQYIYAGYAQLEYSGIKSLDITFGGRFDYERTDSLEINKEISPKVGFSYKITDDINLRASMGTGFRAPSAAERYAAIKFGKFDIIQNVQLKPEKSISFEAGGNYLIRSGNSSFLFDLSAFYSKYDNLIEPTPIAADNGLNIQFRNITKAEIYGAEFDIKSMLFGFLGFETSITAMNPRDLILNEFLKYRSSIIWYNKAALPLWLFEFQMDYRFISKIERVDNFLGNGIKDYDQLVPAHVVDARLIFHFKKISDIPVTLTLNAKNLLDYYFAETIGNLAPTRFIGLQAELAF